MNEIRVKARYRLKADQKFVFHTLLVKL